MDGKQKGGIDLKQVIVTVRGGVAEVYQAPDGVKVLIVDFDNGDELPEEGQDDIANKRLAELESLFWDETNAPETQEWRDNLNETEAKLVAEWDGQYCKGMIAICETILEKGK